MAGNGDGGCQCGAVRYALRGKVQSVYACHCSECRAQSASAFGISVLLRAGDVERLSGETRSWRRVTGSGGHMECVFCARCGTRLWHEAGDVVSVKGGSLDTPPAPQQHIWTSRKLDWVILPDDLPAFPQEPETR